ncbi:MAG: bifunctional demethylmenaquinone methyltransferase/2-methoxy-6-polyprenyl-1,4-benzoquinol methylase UbiE [Myxococcaceae bacterium]|nr:bifunctional demethylmenaquinone methyltransferase/2-methoxy-6-polyprenyl-1,4-benzoquinol methylase UbiE [Myxococcaceae bacterium]
MSEQVHQMFTQIAPRYDVTNDVLSMGTHRLWRKTAVRLSRVKAGDAVLDCATGTGDLAIDFKRAVGPSGTVKGTDFNAAMLSSAPAKAKALGLDISFEVADAMKLPYPAQQFDVSSISFGIRNVDDPKVCLGELARVVKPGGRVVVLEFGQPEGVFGAVFRLYAKLVMPLIGQVLTGNRAAYEYLPRTAAAFPAGERFVDLMRSTGAFSEQSAHPLMAGLAYVYVGVVR